MTPEERAAIIRQLEERGVTLETLAQARARRAAQEWNLRPQEGTRFGVASTTDQGPFRRGLAQPQSAAGRPATRAEAGLMGAADVLSGGALDEVGGFIAQARSLFSPRPGVSLAERFSPQQQERAADIGASMRSGVRQGQEQVQRDRPLSYMGGQLAGGLAVAPAMPTGAALGVGGRMAVGAGAGAAAGGVYGFNSATDADQGGGRWGAAQRGAVTGAAFGAAAPAATGALSRSFNIRNPALATAATGAVGAGVGAAGATALGMPELADEAAVAGATLGAGAVLGSRMVPQRNALSMSIGLPPAGGMRGPQRPPEEIETMARLAQQAGLDEATLAQRLDDAAADPRGQVWADILGQRGIRRARTIAELPGETTELATDRMTTRMAGQGDRLQRRLAGEDADDPFTVLAGRVEETVARSLTPLFDSAPPMARQAAAAALEGLEAQPVVRAALPQAREMVEQAAALGYLPRSAVGDPLQELHYLKIVLQGQAADPTVLGRSSAGRIDNSFLVAAANRASQALDQALPGYQRAMEELQSVILPREVSRALQNAQRGDTVNVAGSVLRNPRIRRMLEREDMAPVGASLRAEDEAYRSAQRLMPGTGSQTTPMAMDMMDQFATEALPLSPTQWLARGAGTLMSPLREGRRNVLGRALYEPVDDALPGYDPARVAAARRAVLEALRRRREATRNAAVGGFQGGLQSPDE